jgi:hypothetical protein
MSAGTTRFASRIAAQSVWAPRFFPLRFLLRLLVRLLQCNAQIRLAKCIEFAVSPGFLALRWRMRPSWPERNQESQDAGKLAAAADV